MSDTRIVFFETEDWEKESIKEETPRAVERLPREKMMEILLGYALLHRDNVVITPHIAFYSEEALERIMRTTEENIRAFFAGSPINVIAANTPSPKCAS